MESKYHKRGTDIFDPSADYAQQCINVIGAGGIGSFVVPAIAKLGIEDIVVWDGDKIEQHNIDNQFFTVKSVGQSKVRALKTLTESLTATEVKIVAKYWESPAKLEGIVISALDSMEATKKDPKSGRKELWEAIKADPKVELLIDTRMGGETFRVLSIRPINDTFKYPWYEKNLFPQAEAAELPCTGRAIIDIGFMAAAVITNLVRRFLKDGEVVHDVAVSMKDLSLIKLEVTRC